MDTYCECLFKKKRTLRDNIIAIIVALVALTLLYYSLILLFIPAATFLAPVVWFGIIWGSVKIIKRQNIEYEYLLTGGDLDVDMVIARASRKKLLSIRRREIELVAPMGSSKLSNVSTDAQITDITSGYNPEAVYVMVTSNDKHPVIYFEPSEKMLNQLKGKIPGKFFEE